MDTKKSDSDLLHDEEQDAPHHGNQFRKILSSAPWYLISSLFTKAIGLILLPVYTRYLSPSDYGVLANLESFLRLLPVLISLYMDTAFLRFYYKEKSISKRNVQVLFSTHYWFLIVFGGAVGMMLIPVSQRVFGELAGISLWPIVAVIFTSLLSQLVLMVLNIWKANLEAKKVAAVATCTGLFTAGMSLLMLIPLDMGWESRIYAAAIASSFQAVAITYLAIRNKWLVFSFDLDILKRSLKYSIPLVPNIAAGWIAGSSDRLILTYYGKIDEAGLYSIAFQIAFVLYVINDSVTQVQSPISMSALTSDKNKAKVQIAEFLMVYVWFMSFFYLVLCAGSKEIFEWFLDERYREAYKLVYILGVLYVVSGIYRVFTNVLTFHGKTWIISVAALFQALVNIALNFAFIPVFGMYAAACSTVVSLFVYTLFIVYQAQKIERISVDILSIGILTGFVVFSTILLGVIDVYSSNLLVAFTCKTIVVFLFLVTLFFSGFSFIRKKATNFLGSL